jgi:predicted protein tyrosine phosphatase
MASENFIPFPVTVCGLQEIADHCGRGVSHVVSILDPAMKEPPAFGSFGEHERIELRFDDIIEEAPGQVLPSRAHVEEILGFGRGISGGRQPRPHLLVHCHMGISRSTAALTLLLAQACPDRSATELLDEILRIRDRAWPNLRMLELGDALLGRNGEIVDAVAGVYEAQLRQRPHLEQYFRDGGRAREVEHALRRL